MFSAQTATARHTASNQKEIIAFEEFDCTQDRYRSLEVQGLNWDGTTTQIFRKPSPWTPSSRIWLMTTFWTELPRRGQEGSIGRRIPGLLQPFEDRYGSPYDGTCNHPGSCRGVPSALPEHHIGALCTQPPFLDLFECLRVIFQR